MTILAIAIDMAGQTLALAVDMISFWVSGLLDFGDVRNSQYIALF